MGDGRAFRLVKGQVVEFSGLHGRKGTEQNEETDEGSGEGAGEKDVAQGVLFAQLPFGTSEFQFHVCDIEHTKDVQAVGLCGNALALLTERALCVVTS